MFYIIVAAIGLVLMAADYGYSTLLGVAIVLADAVIFGLVSFFRENTGDPRGALAALPAALGGVVCDRTGNPTGRQELAVGDCLQVRRNQRTITLGVHQLGGHGGRTLHYLIEAPFAPADYRVSIGKKTMLRLGDNFAGSNCVFYGAKTAVCAGAKLLVGWPQRDEVLARIAGKEKLQEALRGVLVDADFGELRIREGSLSLQKPLHRGDLHAERMRTVLDRVAVILDALSA